MMLSAAFFKSPELPTCQKCEEKQTEQEKKGQRLHGVGKLQTDILLYGELDNPHESMVVCNVRVGAITLRTPKRNSRFPPFFFNHK